MIPFDAGGEYLFDPAEFLSAVATFTGLAVYGAALFWLGVADAFGGAE